MFDFKKAAQEATVQCPIMAGREKISTEEAINTRLTVVAFDFAPKYDKNGEPIVNPSTGEADTYAVVIFKEFPDNYYCAGTVFTKVCRAWMADFETAEQASEALDEYGGVEIMLRARKTKSGNNITTVDIL